MAEQLASRRRGGFILATTIFVVVTIALFRLPELFVEQIRRNRALTSGQAGWVYRLLAIMAFGQAVYVALVLLRQDRIENAWRSDPKLRRLSRSELMDSVTRSAALLPLLTLIYGLSAFALTGERAGFWLFVALTALQLLWSFRQAGQIGSFLDFQPEYLHGGDPGRAEPETEAES